MKGLMLWLQSNPLAVLIMFVIALLSGIITIILGWKKFFGDYLSKEVIIPVWLLILLSIVGCILVIQFAGRRSTDMVVKELESIEGKSFGVQQIVVDGKKFERCYFNGTELIIDGKAGFALINCEFSNTKFTFGRFASNALNALTMMYQDPSFRPLVEKTIENIRAGKHPQSTPIKTQDK